MASVSVIYVLPIKIKELSAISNLRSQIIAIIATYKRYVLI